MRGNRPWGCGLPTFLLSVGVYSVVQIELLSSGAATMTQAFQHRSRHILGHKLLTIAEIKQHMQRQGGTYKVTRVSFKVVKQHPAFSWLQVRCSEVGCRASF